MKGAMKAKMAGADMENKMAKGKMSKPKAKAKKK